jgi:hypothetical protein
MSETLSVKSIPVDLARSLVKPGAVVMAKLLCGHVHWGQVEWIKEDICFLGGMFCCFYPGCVSLDRCAEIWVYPAPEMNEHEKAWLARTGFPLG